MNFEQAIDLINTYRGKGEKRTLRRVESLLEKVGNPEEQLKAIHVAGTNGKGTTCAFLASTLQKAGFKTGFYTSPHLETIHERITINGEMISTEDLIRFTEVVEPFVREVEKEFNEKMYSFEILTVVAFLYFVDQKIDILVLETGMGGRFDATNTIKNPIVTVITSIGFDHMYMLGDSIEEITLQKAGIIKKDTPVIVYPMDETIIKEIEQAAASMNAPMTVVEDSAVELVEQTIQHQVYSYKNFKNVEMTMIGNHQILNSLLAIQALVEVKNAGYDLAIDQIYQGIKETIWPGRMEKISDEPVVFIDGAHNVPGVTALRDNLTQLFPDKKLTLFVGIMKDKEFMEMLDLVEDLADKMYILSPDEGKGFDPFQVSRDLQKLGYPAEPLDNVEKIKYYIEEKAQKDEIIIIFGSLYLVGDMRGLLVK